MLKIVPDDAHRDDLAATLDELVAEGARRMLIAGLESEVADYVARHESLVDEAGHRLVVRNGRAAERSLTTGAGELKVRVPRVNDRREGRLFSSYILPKYARRSPKVADVLPVLYLRGLSTGDFAPALTEFFGSDAGLSATSITRLVETWGDEYEAFIGRDLSESDYAIHEIYLAETWADANTGIDEFARLYGDKYPKAVDKLIKDRDVLLTFYEFPAAHWVHLRTTNPIESTFATVRARTKVTKGAGSRRRGLVMAYKLLDAAEDRWRKVNSPELVIQVRAGIEFKDGIRVERRTHQSRDAA